PPCTGLTVMPPAASVGVLNARHAARRIIRAREGSGDAPHSQLRMGDGVLSTQSRRSPRRPSAGLLEGALGPGEVPRALSTEDLVLRGDPLDSGGTSAVDIVSVDAARRTSRLVDSGSRGRGRSDACRWRADRDPLPRASRAGAAATTGAAPRFLRRT